MQSIIFVQAKRKRPAIADTTPGLGKRYETFRSCGSGTSNPIFLNWRLWRVAWPRWLVARSAIAHRSMNLPAAQQGRHPTTRKFTLIFSCEWQFWLFLSLSMTQPSLLSGDTLQNIAGTLNFKEKTYQTISIPKHFTTLEKTAEVRKVLCQS